MTINYINDSLAIEWDTLVTADGNFSILIVNQPWVIGTSVLTNQQCLDLASNIMGYLSYDGAGAKEFSEARAKIAKSLNLVDNKQSTT